MKTFQITNYENKIFYFALLLVVETLLIGCSKSNSTPEPEPPGKNFKYKVVEYKTNDPIYNAMLEFSYCTPSTFNIGCSSIRTVGTWHSDINGEIFIKATEIKGSVNMNSFSKENYWSKGHIDSYISTPTQDSGVVRLFPYSWLKIHIKNEVFHNAVVNINMHFDAIIDSFPTDYSPGQSFVHTANNLDTTIIYTTYGNIKNIVDASLDSSGSLNQVYSKTQFVSKNDTVYFEILLK
ncbi:MAG: hypothetical protein V4717_14595 [Bacteroidota bacterium]